MAAEPNTRLSLRGHVTISEEEFLLKYLFHALRNPYHEDTNPTVRESERHSCILNLLLKKVYIYSITF